jgi:hypothetical protein
LDYVAPRPAGFVGAADDAESRPEPDDQLAKKDFAEPSKRAYPIEDKPHARNAKARGSQAQKAGRMSKAEEAKIDRKADAVLRDS